MAINGIAVAAASAGAIFLWGALHNQSFLTVLKDVISGKKPGAGPEGTSAGTQSAAALNVGNAATDLVGGGGLYSQSQLESLWMLAGGSSGSSHNAGCHGMQESGGNAKVTSPNPDGGINVGLWQLDTRGVGAGHSVAQLQDAMTNARITVSATQDGKNWSQWATPGC